MRLLPFGSVLMLAPLLLSAGACADGDVVSNPHDSGAGRDSAGAQSAGSASGGAKPTGGSAAGGSAAGGSAAGGTTPEGGEPAVTEGGAGGQPSGGEAGTGGANSAEECAAPTGVAILGDYVDPSGDQWWLRDSGKAVTLVRVPSGKPTASRPPALWQVVEACGDRAALLLKTPSGAYTRLDYLAGSTSLTLCLASETAATLALAAALPAADRTNTIDRGCNSGPWTRVVKGEK